MYKYLSLRQIIFKAMPVRTFEPQLNTYGKHNQYLCIHIGDHSAKAVEIFLARSVVNYKFSTL